MMYAEKKDAQARITVKVTVTALLAKMSLAARKALRRGPLATPGMTTVGLVAVNVALVAVACGEPAIVDDRESTPGIEVWLDVSGRPENTVHVPGRPGDAFRVRVYDHSGKMLNHVAFTDVADVVRSMPAETRAQIPQIAPHVVRGLSESLPPEARSKVPRAIEILANEILVNDLSPEERAKVIQSIEEIAK